VAALAEVIDALVDDDGAADDRVGAEEGDAGVCTGVGSQQEVSGCCAMRSGAGENGHVAMAMVWPRFGRKGAGKDSAECEDRGQG
jgi:hypothetical protein